LDIAYWGYPHIPIEYEGASDEAAAHIMRRPMHEPWAL
jgi:hypothetical protein